MKRFLNADSYGSTGQGFLGYNMFAYCGNNPIMCLDTSGEDYIWQRLFEDYCFGFIHLAVQKHIIKTHPELEMEKAVYDATRDKCGRADIFNLKTGEVWELKTVRTGAEKAAAQVAGYCEPGNYLDGSESPLHEGTPYIAGYFELECMGDYYQVEYFSPQPGVVLYKAIRTRAQTQPNSYAVYVPKKEKTKDR